MSQAQPRDIFESEFEKALKQYDEAIARIHDLKGQVEKHFLEIQTLQLGGNTLEQIRNIRYGMVSGQFHNLTLLDEQKAKQIPLIKLDGWDANYTEIVAKFQKIDESLSYVPDIITDFIKILSQSSALDKAHVTLPTPGSEQVATIVKEEKGGVFGWLRGAIEALRPQYKKDFERGMGIMATIIEDFYNAYKIWEEYKSYYMENRARAMIFHPKSMYPYLLLQDELLMKDMGTILRVVDKGTRLDLIHLRRVLSDISSNIVQTRAAQLNQQTQQMQVRPNGH